MKEVNYSSGRLIFEKIEKTLFNNNLNELDINALLTTKFKHWHYEEESRVFVNLIDCIKEGEYYFYKLGNDVKLKGIIRGTLCDMSELEIAKRLSRGSKLKITQARLAFRTFSVVRNLAIKERIVIGKA